ncbi:MAG: V-type ATP synthase subunit E family protein [Thermoplasmataceae archaeon]
MTLEDILKDIEARGDGELKNLSEYYEQKISEFKKKQDIAIRNLQEKYEKITEEEVRSVERTTISSGEMEALKIVRSRESSLIEEAMGKATIYLKELRNSRYYKDIMARMVAVARASLGGKIIIRVSSRDSSLIPQSKDLVIKEEEVDPYGGIIAQSSDGSMQVELTLTSIMQDIKEKLISRISEHLGE